MVLRLPEKRPALATPPPDALDDIRSTLSRLHRLDRVVRERLTQHVLDLALKHLALKARPLLIDGGLQLIDPLPRLFKRKVFLAELHLPALLDLLPRRRGD